jgi:thiol peroxidase
MATVTRKGESVETVGELPTLNSAAPEFTLVDTHMVDLNLADLKGKTVILNIFPSLDTPTCATSVREFNVRASSLDNVVVIGVSADLPFAMKRFCTAEGIEHVLSGSTFRSTFGADYGVTFTTGGLTGLLSRAIVLIDGEGVVRYTEQVPDTSQQPNYDAVLAAM